MPWVITNCLQDMNSINVNKNRTCLSLAKLIHWRLLFVQINTLVPVVPSTLRKTSIGLLMTVVR